MRFPWLQVDLDFITAHSRDLGALLGVSRREAIGLAMDLWTWVLGRSTAAAPPDGIVRGPSAERLLAGAVDWAGDPAALLDALAGAGLVERIGDDVRVRGLSRYKPTWEKNQRRNGTGPAPENNRTGTAPEPTRKTQTQTQTQTQRAEDLSPASPATQREPLRLEPQEAPRRARRKEPATTDHRHAPLVKALVEEIGFPFDGGKDAQNVKALLALADQQPATSGEAAPAEILRRARIARGQHGFNSARTLGDFRAHWGRFEAPEQHRAGPAPPSDFSRPPTVPPRSEFAPDVSDEPF